MNYQTLHCIALRTVKYNDRHSILTAYTREHGRMSFLLPAGSGKEAARRRALMMPMGLFECTADLRPGRDIPPMREPAPILPLHGIRSNPVKGLIAMFLAEFGLALVSRFAPSLNVFILAMPIKSLVASLLLVLYLGILMEHAYDALLLAVDPLRLLRPVLETP